nr:MAG TPA: hypothetical protein [Caudoviricetes sp.]
MPFGYYHIYSITAKTLSVKRSIRFSSKRPETSWKIVYSANSGPINEKKPE